MYKVTQKPSPHHFLGRSTYQPIAIVHHRMVGFLTGTDAHFANPTTQVSAHFGVGFRGDNVEISQYVDLSNAAWSNGNYDSTGGWPLVKKTSSGTIINPNYYTVSIEHEDGGPNDGRVREPVLQASLWLNFILLSGKIDLIKFVGIKVSNPETVTALGAIVPGAETLIDHSRISGVKKPFCWRPVALDTQGFAPWKLRLLDYLRSTSVAISDVLALLEQEVNKLIEEKNLAVADAQEAVQAKAVVESKLLVAKQEADTILNSVGAIVTSANRIKVL